MTTDCFSCGIIRLSATNSELRQKKMLNGTMMLLKPEGHDLCRQDGRVARTKRTQHPFFYDCFSTPWHQTGYYYIAISGTPAFMCCWGFPRCDIAKLHMPFSPGSDFYLFIYLFFAAFKQHKESSSILELWRESDTSIDFPVTLLSTSV